MFRARKQLGKRQTADSVNGFRPKKFRTDQQVPTFEDGQAVEDGEERGGPAKDGADGAANVGRFARRIVRGQTGNVLLDCEIPRYGTPVERKQCRKAGDYVIGHELGTSPGVPQTQYLARKQGTDEYYLLKILSFDPETEVVDKEALQGKVLLHNEYTLLSMLDDLDGVIHQHGFFSDYAFEESQIEKDDGTVTSIYTGRIRRRLMLVLDCVHAHEFCERSSTYISLQRYITVTKYTEHEALQLFYEVVKVVEQLHDRNIIHRDLKLNNIVLNRRTKRIVLTNFFLGKQLINEEEVLFDQRGSPAYISPDVLGGKPYKGKPSDIWALGVILYTIIYGKFPFLDTTPTALFRKIREVDYIIPAGFKTSEKTNTLIKSMLTLNPDERFTATEVRVQLEQMLRKMRPVKLDIDQLVPELSASDEALAGIGGPIDQSIPTERDPAVASGTGGRAASSAAPASTSSAPGEPMEVVAEPAPAPIAPRERPHERPTPKHELSTEPFSRLLETNNQRHELGADGFPKPKHVAGGGSVKKITTTLRFTPSGTGGAMTRSGGQGGSPNAATGLLQQASRSLSSAGGTPLSGSVAGSAGGHRNRFNFNLNVQYSARSYNSAARAVAAAVAAVRGAGAVATGPGVEWVRNGTGSSSNNNNNAPSPNTAPSSPLISFSQTIRTLRTPSGSQPQSPEANTLAPAPVVGAARAHANTSPQPAPVAAGANGSGPQATPPQSLPPAAQRLYAIMNYISLIRGRLPAQPTGGAAQGAGGAPSPPRLVSSPSLSPPVGGADADVGPGLEFNGIITQAIADKIVPYLIVNLRHHEWVVDLFRAVSGGPSDPDQRVNNLLELLRQLGVRMEARNGQIVIRAEQTRERHQFLGVLLRIAGFNDNYFVQQQLQQQQTAQPQSPAQPMA